MNQGNIIFSIIQLSSPLTNLKFLPSFKRNPRKGQRNIRIKKVLMFVNSPADDDTDDNHDN